MSYEISTGVADPAQDYNIEVMEVTKADETVASGATTSVLISEVDQPDVADVFARIDSSPKVGVAYNLRYDVTNDDYYMDISNNSSSSVTVTPELTAMLIKDQG